MHISDGLDSKATNNKRNRNLHLHLVGRFGDSTFRAFLFDYRIVIQLRQWGDKKE